MSGLDDLYDGRGGFVTGSIYLDYGDDKAFGGTGDEIFIMGGGTNVLDAGGGNDTFGAFGPSTIDLSITQQQQTCEDSWDTILNVENVRGSGFADHFMGNGGGNVLTGEGGDDKLEGRGGNDTLVGGEGTDTADFHGPLLRLHDHSRVGWHLHHSRQSLLPATGPIRCGVWNSHASMTSSTA